MNRVRIYKYCKWVFVGGCVCFAKEGWILWEEIPITFRRSIEENEAMISTELKCRWIKLEIDS